MSSSHVRSVSDGLIMRSLSSCQPWFGLKRSNVEDLALHSYRNGTGIWFESTEHIRKSLLEMIVKQMLHPLILICFFFFLFFCDEQRSRQLSDAIKSPHCALLSTDLIRHSEITEPGTCVHLHICGLRPSGELCSLIVLEVSLWREPLAALWPSRAFSVSDWTLRALDMRALWELASTCVLTLEVQDWM